MVFDNPKWNFRSFNFDSDVKLTDSRLGPVLNSTNPDLEPFKARGGKLIQYHGWADAAIAPMSSIDYYERVLAVARRKTGGNALKETQSFYRLFMAPGMEHCGGGPGANVFGNAFGTPPKEDDAQHDVVKALERWVEQGVAPEKIIATKYVDDKPAKGVARTRPLCPYPEEAQWTGKGSTNDAANFVCRLGQ
ncbi:MAG TPA: tannase/feruloyl esterase family alpha/beta hydrolase [Terriglobia bacterium]|nr:tannase/feruloyl esterase family alpha/beta hydrolase [Terriglobia bacterium]